MKRNAIYTITVTSAFILAYFGTLFYRKKFREKRGKKAKSIKKIPNELKNFVFEKMICKNTALGHYSKDSIHKIIIKFEFSEINAENITNTLENINKMDCFNKNGNYNSYSVFLNGNNFNMKFYTIFPAPKFEISKRIYQPFFKIVETPEIYLNCTLPYIDSFTKEDIDWITKIFDKKSEQNRIVYQFEHILNGFVLLPDEKTQPDSPLSEIHYLAIAQDVNLKSLRSLNSFSVELLKNIEQNGLKSLCERLGVKKSEIICFVHYLPTFFRFHVHFVHISNTRSMKSSHYLEDIIKNLEMKGNYYENTNLVMFCGEKRHKKIIEKLND